MKIKYIKISCFAILASALYLNSFRLIAQPVSEIIHTNDEIQKQYQSIISSIRNIRIDNLDDALRIVIDADRVFEVNSPEFKDLNENDIKLLCENFKKYPNNKFIITIHSDSDGDDNINLRISKKRAEALEEFLKKKGIKESRFDCIGVGENQALQFKKDDIIKTNNRIEVLIIAN